MQFTAKGYFKIFNKVNSNSYQRAKIQIHLEKRVVMGEFIMRMATFLETQLQKAELYKRNINLRFEDANMQFSFFFCKLKLLLKKEKEC